MPEPIPPRARPTDGLKPDPVFWGDDNDRRRSLPRPRVGSGLDAWRDRIDEWRADARFGVIALVVIAVIAGVVWYRVGVSGGSGDESTTSEASAPASAPRAPRDPVATTQPGESIIVHVAGAVTRPGVAELPAGSRVIDAVEAAGGALADGDLDQLNLAAKVADGERVLVPRVGEIGVAAPTSGSGSAAGATTGALLNLNTATTEQLEELPGIGPVLAGAILDERERRGGFGSVNELREVRGIGEKRFADLRDLVTV